MVCDHARVAVGHDGERDGNIHERLVIHDNEDPALAGNTRIDVEAGAGGAQNAENEPAVPLGPFPQRGLSPPGEQSGTGRNGESRYDIAQDEDNAD